MAGGRVDVYFMCIGGNKCGTTWLYEMLRQHPEINAPVNKEPHFFSENFERGWGWYRRNWSEESGRRGEFSTTYLYSEEALRRIAATQPHVRLLVLMRQPFERATSHLRHLLRTETVHDMGNFLEKHPEVVENSLYAKHLARVQQHFAPERVKVLFFDQLEADPWALLQDVWRFLEVDPAFVPARLHEVIGAGFSPKSAALDRLRMAVYRFMKRRGLYETIRRIKQTGVTEAYKRLLGDEKERAAREGDPLKDALEAHRPAMLEDLRRLQDMALVEDRETYVAQWMESLSERAP